MGFWDNVNDELKKAVEEGWTVVKENAKAGKLRYRAHTLQKEAQKHLSEIGSIVYDSVKFGKQENPATGQDVISLVDKIKKLEQQTEALQQEIAQLKGKEVLGPQKP